MHIQKKLSRERLTERDRERQRETERERERQRRTLFFVCVTWLVHTCDMTHTRSRHPSRCGYTHTQIRAHEKTHTYTDADTDTDTDADTHKLSTKGI